MHVLYQFPISVLVKSGFSVCLQQSRPLDREKTAKSEYVVKANKSYKAMVASALLTFINNDFTF